MTTHPGGVEYQWSEGEFDKHCINKLAATQPEVPDKFMTEATSMVGTIEGEVLKIGPAKPGIWGVLLAIPPF